MLLTTALSRTIPALAAVAVLASACGFEDGDGFGAGDTLLVPDDIELHWDESFNAVDDGLGAVVPVDVMVYDGATGEPREGVEVDVIPGADAYVLTEGELTPVDPESCVDCALFWDAWRDQFYALEVDLAGGVARVRTDQEGIARVFVLVDAMGGSDGDFAPVSVQVETRDADGGFLILNR